MKELSEWVSGNLSRMSLEQKVAQMLMPNFRPQSSPESMEDILVPGYDPGGVFFFGATSGEFKRASEWLQARCSLPALVASDLESGAGRVIDGCVTFPDLMALAASGDIGLAREQGRVTALEAREHGVHWTLGPVADLNANPYNPIVCTRSLGDDEAKVGAFVGAIVSSMQENGMVACAKHFPGDGWDDRDQHVCTSTNPLSVDDWFRLSGKPFADAIAAGVKSVMIGHIALPSVDPGNPDDPLGPPPASMSRKIVTGLLRERMGFDGVIITDALEMGGLVSRMRSHRELIVEVVNAGCDVLLFSVAREDFGIIVDAVKSGEIPHERIDGAVARILTLKEWLGFAQNPCCALPHAIASPTPNPEQGLIKNARTPLPGESHGIGFEWAAIQVAYKAMTLVRDCADRPHLKIGDPILAIHLRSNPQYNIDAFDGLLAGEGFNVVRKTESDLDGDWLSEKSLSGFAAIIFLWNMGPTWGTADIRPGGTFMRIPWFLRMRYPSCPVFHVSFGYPYLLHDLPWAGYILNAYSPDIHSQRAALDVILGRQPAPGKSPVDLMRPERLRELLAREIAENR